MKVFRSKVAAKAYMQTLKKNYPNEFEGKYHKTVLTTQDGLHYITIKPKNQRLI